jgi:kumamolisin
MCDLPGTLLDACVRRDVWRLPLHDHLVVGAAGAWVSESAWSGGGGGVSSVFAQPKWQKDVLGSIDRGRNLPDVSLDAEPQTGAAFYIGSLGGWNTDWNPIGGTSLASPIYVVSVVQNNQVEKSRGSLTSAALYSFWDSKGYGTTAAPYFHDIALGNNGPYFAAPGYDLATGIGSVESFALVRTGRPSTVF